jgi:hypothetical protein
VRPKRRAKTGAVVWAGLLALGVFGPLGACRSDDPKPNVGAIADASYGDVPTRGVTSDLPDGLNLFGDGPDVSLSGNVGSTPVASTDASQDKPGNRPPDASGPPDAGAAMCSLIRQDCTGSRGCYPATGGATCRPAGGLVENVPCDQHDDCAPGLVCADVFAGAGKLCQPVCDTTAVRPCADNRACRPLMGSLIGSCEP